MRGAVSTSHQPLPAVCHRPQWRPRAVARHRRFIIRQVMLADHPAGSI